MLPTGSFCRKSGSYIVITRTNALRRTRELSFWRAVLNECRDSVVAILQVLNDWRLRRVDTSKIQDSESQ